MPTIATQTYAEFGGPRGILVHQRRDHVRLDGQALRPPANVAAALPLAVVDRSRGGLAAASGALEHVAPLPFGEREQTHRAG